MSRLFDGSVGLDQVIVLDPGSVPAAGPFTILSLWRASEVVSGGIIQARNAGSPVWSLQHESDGKYYSGDFTGFSGYVAAQWEIIGYSKAAGNTAVRWHRYRYTTDTWSHGNGSNLADGSGPDAIWLGKAFGRMDGNWVASGAWSSVLADATIEAADLDIGLAKWSAASPVALWAGNQTLASDSVLDLVGSAHQSSVIGTAPPVSSDEPPGWSYALSTYGTASAVLGALTATAVVVPVGSGRPISSSTRQPLAVSGTRQSLIVSGTRGGVV